MPVPSNLVQPEGDWSEGVLLSLAKLREGGNTQSWSVEDLLSLRLYEYERRDESDYIPDTSQVAVVQSGDVWTMGDHRLMCGDSTDQVAVETLMQGESGILMATDPPYGVNFFGQKYNPTAKAWNAIRGDEVQGEDLRQFIVTLLKIWLPQMYIQSAFYFWTASMLEGFAAAKGILDSGLHIQSQIIWTKNNLALGQSDYHWKHENCWYAFWKGRNHRWFGERTKTSVWEIKRVSSQLYLHPMQKPVELYERPMLNHTLPGELVVEPFAGSGTQFIAAQNLGRRCYGMELDPIYCDVILDRWARYTGLDPVRESDGKSWNQLKKESPPDVPGGLR